MPRYREDTRSGGEKRGFLWEELKSLIDALQDLQKQISAKLLESRIHPPGSPRKAENSIDIDALLMECIESGVGGAETAYEISPTLEEPTEESGAWGSDSGNGKKAAAPRRDRGLLPNELSKHLKSLESSHELEQCMGEKLQASTLEHINRALRLAKRGDRENAYVHAELAENAMRLAGEYLSDPAYRAFGKEVEERLETAAGKR